MDEIRLDEQESQGGKAKQWIQDNLRIIISIAVVVLIAGGIYSYSKRGATPDTSSDEVITEDNSDNLKISGEKTDQNDASDNKQESAPAAQQQKNDVVTPASSETTGSFIETAAKGDGATHLARRALANYLEKNPDSQLRAEQKIYIEDYLRKNSGFKGHVRVGTTIEFQKDLIQNAIEKSKSLNDAQIRNLHKYALMVPSLS